MQQRVANDGQQGGHADAQADAERNADRAQQKALKQHVAADLTRRRADGAEHAVEPRFFGDGNGKAVADNEHARQNDNRHHDDRNAGQNIHGLLADGKGAIAQKRVVGAELINGKSVLRQLFERRVHLVLCAEVAI